MSKPIIRNPLGYTCAANYAPPSYVTAQHFRDFVAYGLLTCWLGEGSDSDSNPNAECHYVRPITVQDVDELRLVFIDRLEWVLFKLWGGDAEPGAGALDCGSLSVVIERCGDDPESVSLGWHVTLGFDAIMLELDDESDGLAIWLAYEAVADRRAVLAVLLEAYRVVNGTTAGPSETFINLVNEQPEMMEGST